MKFEIGDKVRILGKTDPSVYSYNMFLKSMHSDDNTIFTIQTINYHSCNRISVEFITSYNLPCRGWDFHINDLVL